MIKIIYKSQYSLMNKDYWTLTVGTADHYWLSLIQSRNHQLLLTPTPTKIQFPLTCHYFDITLPMTMESFHPLLWPNNKILMFCNNKFINMFTDFLVVFWLDLIFWYLFQVLDKFIVLYYLSKYFLEKSTLFFIIFLVFHFRKVDFVLDL